MYLGVDYYPEHWDQFMVDDDMERIRNTGANTIRIGEFAWHLMEPENEQIDFSYFDHIIKKAKAYELKVIFGTPTATFPAWLAKKHPSILSKDVSGHTRVFGGRRQYCFNSDLYIQYAKGITEKLTKHYAREEAIVAWQIDNEFGHEGSDLCYCETCHEKFQAYLHRVYGHIDILNKTYGTVFWGQTYNHFNEIPMPTATITTHNPSLQLDWARFKSESINTFAKIQIDVVNKYKGVHQKVTHNYFGGFFDLAYDQHEMSEHLDVVSYDNYPVWGGLEEPITPSHIAMTHDYMRGLKKQNFWILEELMGAQGHTNIGYLPRPNQAKLWAYQAVAKGCESLLFFRWRTMTRGAEQHCQGILDVDNKDNRKLKEVTDFFHDIKKYEKELKTPIESEVAIIYDFDNSWSWKSQPQSSGFDFTKEFLRLYEGFHRKNVNVDVLNSNASFEGYKVIVLPVMQIMDLELKDRLNQFVKMGGVVLFTFRSGIKDRQNNLILGQESPHFIRELCGIKIKEIESLGNHRNVEICGSGKRYNAYVWRDLIEINEAKALFHYKDIPYNKFAAVTENSVGKGKVFYIGCGIDANAVDVIVDKVIALMDLNDAISPDKVEVVIRGNKAHRIRFVLNHNAEVVHYNGCKLEPYEVVIERI